MPLSATHCRILWSKSGGVDTLARAFARTHAEPAHAPAKVTNVSSAELIMYIEPNVLANALYSEHAIKLLVGSFYALFGSTRGGLLRQFAAARRVALTWAIGACSTGFISDENVSFAGDVRLLDWPTSGAMLNATASPGDAASFAALTARLDYLDAGEVAQVRQAYRFADEAHLGQLRNQRFARRYIERCAGHIQQHQLCATGKRRRQTELAARAGGQHEERLMQMLCQCKGINTALRHRFIPVRKRASTVQ